MSIGLDWKEQLKGLIVEKQGNFQNGEVTPMFREVAEQFQVPLGTVRSAFYRLKKEVGEVLPTLMPCVGDTIEVRVKTIASYGVIMETLDGGIHGLVHISSVKDEFIEDLNRYFKIGDVVRAEVINIEGDRVSLSTINSDLPDYWCHRSLSRPINRVESYVTVPVVTTVKSEHDEVRAYFEKNFGKLGNEANGKLQDLIKAHGLFQFTLALGKLEPKDYALYILELLESNLRGSL